MAVLTRVVLWSFCLVLTTGCRMGQEQWGPFRGRVVDAETGRPISGANVVVLWWRTPPALDYIERFYDAQETVTDVDGRFEIPRKFRFRFLTAYVIEPRFTIFAPGYLTQAPHVSGGGRRYVDATVVPMRPLMTREERCKHEPFGVTGAAHALVPRFVQAERDYQRALRCGDLP